MTPSSLISSHSSDRSSTGRATQTDTSEHSSARSCSNNSAGRAARAIHERVRATVPGKLTPAALTAVPDQTLLAAGLSANKLASLRDLSAKVIDRTLELDKSARLDDDELIASLTAVRGIGRWTAEMYLMFELRRLDVWPVDDLGVRQGYGLAWQLEPPPSAKELAPLGNRTAPTAQSSPATAGKQSPSSAAEPTRPSDRCSLTPVRYSLTCHHVLLSVIPHRGLGHDPPVTRYVTRRLMRPGRCEVGFVEAPPASIRGARHASSLGGR